MRVLKTVTYKLGSILLTIGIVYVFTRRIDLATGVALLDLALTTLWYYYHDWAWTKLETHVLFRKYKKIAARYEEYIKQKET